VRPIFEVIVTEDGMHIVEASERRLTFEWDEAKRLKTLADRAIDFRQIRLLWRTTTVRTRSDRNGELRWQIVGPFEGKLFSVVYTEVDDVIRIISARRARAEEEEWYRSLLGG